MPEKELAVFQTISTYREDGHLKANLDPLQLKSANTKSPPCFLSTFGLTEKDLKKNISNQLCPGNESRRIFRKHTALYGKKPTAELLASKWEDANQR